MIASLAALALLAPANVKVQVLANGKGRASANGDIITVVYKGTLKDGVVFDETGASKAPFAFKLGAGQVIKGWDKGFLGRKIGDKLKLTVPPELAYGARTVGTIPPNSTLTFEAKVLRIDPKGSKPAVQTTEIKLGKGQPVAKGDKVSIHYKGTFLNGHKFDSSYDRKEPFDFKVAAGEVVQGFDDGVMGMKVGGKRKVVIPYGLAYGEQGRPPAIPRMATLVFEIELIKRG